MPKAKQKDDIRVLLVEDDDDLRVLWEAALADEFDQVISAADGKSGLEMAAFCNPDIIISDILLPKLDGFSLCNQLKLSPATYRIPVILYSAAFIDEKDRQLALGYGAARILQKNISIHELVALTREVITEANFNDFISDIGDSIEAQNLTDLHVQRMSEKLTDLLAEISSQRQELRSTVDRFRDFASCMSDYFWETNAQNKLVFAAIGKRSSLNLSQFGYHDHNFKSYFTPYFVSEELEKLVAEMSTGNEIEMHLGFHGNDNDKRIVQVIAKPYFDGHYKLAGYRGVFSDITERHRQSEKLTHQATHDQLTGLYNRRGLERGYAEAISVSAATAEHVLCYLDLDGFKAVNDTAGHTAGDNLLVAFSKLLTDTARKSDLVIRLGGDEFALFMPNCDIHASRRLVNDLHRKVSEFLFHWEGHTFAVAMSIGCVVTQGCDASLDSLLQEADQACYRAKQSGGDQVCVFSGSPSLTQEVEVAKNQLTLEKFTEALSKDKFALYKQPIVSSGVNRIVMGYEILLRLKESSVVMLPAMILPLAKSYCLSVMLDRWVVANTLQWLMHDEQMKRSKESAAINLSSASVCDASFASDLVELISSTGIEKGRLVFEISEKTLHDHPDQTRAFIQALKASNCLLVLDNFGGGLASLANLTGLDVDQLKLSGQLIRALKDNPMQLEIVKGIQSLANALGFLTIAQNVESSEVSVLLNQAGVARQQGFYFSKPVPLAQKIGDYKSRQESA